MSEFIVKAERLLDTSVGNMEMIADVIRKMRLEVHGDKHSEETHVRGIVTGLLFYTVSRAMLETYYSDETKDANNMEDIFEIFKKNYDKATKEIKA